jgi:hypothetical protein
LSGPKAAKRARAWSAGGAAKTSKKSFSSMLLDLALGAGEHEVVGHGHGCAVA